MEKAISERKLAKLLKNYHQAYSLCSKLSETKLGLDFFVYLLFLLTYVALEENVTSYDMNSK